MLTVNPIRDREEILRRIVFLGGALVGCGQICSCRARLAMIITADEMKQVEALAADVQFARASGGIPALRKILGEPLTPIRKEVVEMIDRTPRHPDYVRTKESGGMVAAGRSLDQMFEQELDPRGHAARRAQRMVAAALSGDSSLLPAGVHMFRLDRES